MSTGSEKKPGVLKPASMKWLVVWSMNSLKCSEMERPDIDSVLLIYIEIHKTSSIFELWIYPSIS